MRNPFKKIKKAKEKKTKPKQRLEIKNKRYYLDDAIVSLVNERGDLVLLKEKREKPVKVKTEYEYYVYDKKKNKVKKLKRKDIDKDWSSKHKEVD